MAWLTPARQEVYKSKRKIYRGTSTEGYIVIYPDVDKYGLTFDYPGSRPDGRILEHRYLMQEHIGRPLHAEETIHHINGNKMDNRIENLELRIGRHGKGWAVEAVHCPTCRCGEN